MTNAFVIIAHRGNQSRAPENTTDAFQASLDAGFQHFETDVQLTQDGVPIILHDEQLGRTIPGAGSVAERTWEELKDLDAGSWYCAAVGAHEAHAQITGRVHGFAHCRVPTLEAVLAAFLGRAHIHLVRHSLRHGNVERTCMAAVRCCAALHAHLVRASRCGVCSQCAWSNIQVHMHVQKCMLSVHLACSCGLRSQQRTWHPTFHVDNLDITASPP